MPWREPGTPFDREGPTYNEVFSKSVGKIDPRRNEMSYRNSKKTLIDLFGNLNAVQALGLGAGLMFLAVWLPFLLIAPLPNGYLLNWYGLPYTITTFAAAGGLGYTAVQLLRAGWRTMMEGLAEDDTRESRY